MDHAELIAELSLIEQLPVLKRLELARKRRVLQLVKCRERELKEQLNDPKNRLIKIKFPPTISLLDATFRADVDEIRNLLNAGVDPNSRNEDGLTPLHQCCIDNNEEVLLLLLAAGADVNARDTEQWTPLHAASCCGHLSIARHLVDHGADLLAVNADGNMPYDICDDDLTLDFLESEMARRGVTQENIDMLRMAVERQMLLDMQRIHGENADLEFRDSYGATPLHIACANGFASVAQFLLDCGVAVDAKDNDGWTPLHCAACWSQPHILELLVAYGADIGSLTDAGETALELCEEPEVRDVILELSRQQVQQHFQRQYARPPQQQQQQQQQQVGNQHIDISNIRDSRMSKRKKPQSKFESPQFTSNSSLSEAGHHSTSRVLRRLSFRDKNGETLAQIEAKREALVRNQSIENAEKGDGNNISQALGVGADSPRSSKKKQNFKQNNHNNNNFTEKRQQIGENNNENEKRTAAASMPSDSDSNAESSGVDNSRSIGGEISATEWLRQRQREEFNVASVDANSIGGGGGGGGGAGVGGAGSENSSNDINNDASLRMPPRLRDSRKDRQKQRHGNPPVPPKPPKLPPNSSIQVPVSNQVQIQAKANANGNNGNSQTLASGNENFNSKLNGMHLNLNEVQLQVAKSDELRAFDTSDSNDVKKFVAPRGTVVGSEEAVARRPPKSTGCCTIL